MKSIYQLIIFVFFYSFFIILCQTGWSPGTCRQPGRTVRPVVIYLGGKAPCPAWW